MLLLPVAARELSVQSCKRSTHWIRLLASGIAVCVVAWSILLGATPLGTGGQGRALFTILSGLAFGYSLLIGAMLTADCLSEEKREGTLGLLFLTHLNGFDVVAGKLVSSSVHAVYGLLAIVPMMSLALLFGGVTPAEVSRTALVLGNTLFLSLSAGVFVSAISRNERRAMVTAVFLVLTIALGPFAAEAILFLGTARQGSPFGDDAILSFSPVHAFNLCRVPAFGPVQFDSLCRSVAQIHAVAWLLLVLACGAVRTTGRDRPRGQMRERWTERFRNWTCGGKAGRALHRRRLLDRNPCFWLSLRSRLRAMSVWVLIVPLAGIGIWVYAKYWTMFDFASLFLLITIHVLLKTWLTSEVCNRWLEDRRSGALELLLCTPQQSQEIIRGQSLALWRQFGWPVAATLGLTFLASIAFRGAPGNAAKMEVTATWMLASLPVLVADCLAIRWIGMWNGITARGLNRAIARTLGSVLMVRWIAYLAIAGFEFVWSWMGSPSAAFKGFPVLWMSLALFFDLIFLWVSRKRFLRCFRAIASNPWGESISNDWTHIEPMNQSEMYGVPPSGGSDRLKPGLHAGPWRESADVTQEPVNLSTVPSGEMRRIQPWWSRARANKPIVVTALILFVAGAFWGYHFWLDARIENRLDKLRRAGIAVSMEDLDRERASPDPAEDVTELMSTALTSVVPFNSLPPFIRQNVGLFGNEIPHAVGVFPPQMKAAMLALVSSNRSALTIVREIASQPNGSYSIDWRGKGIQAALQSMGFWMLTRAMQYDVLVKWDEGDFDGAMESLRLLFELSRSLASEPAFAQYQMRRSVDGMTFNAVQFLLNRIALRAPDLETVQKWFDESVHASNLEQVLIAFRVHGIEWHKNLGLYMSGMGRSMGGGAKAQMLMLRERLREWSGATDFEFLAFMDAIEDAPRIVGNSNSRELRTLIYGGAKSPALRPPGNQFPRLDDVYVLQHCVAPFLEAEARRRSALTAVAIERYRARNQGGLPDRLEKLVSEFISKVPVDPFDGQTIKYKKVGSGYRIYSVGIDGDDDGGLRANNMFAGSPLVPEGDVVFFNDQ